MKTEAMTTDWDRYYENGGVPKMIMNRILSRFSLCIRKHCDPDKEVVVAELGGGNSHIYEMVAGLLNVREYHVLDNNETGLRMFRQKAARPGAYAHSVDLLALQPLDIAADLVLSLGVVEHFPPEQTRLLIGAHLALSKPGGIAILSFPTPTAIYWSFRRFLEYTGQWPCPDERPLTLREIEHAINGGGRLLHCSRIWSALLTQMIVVTQTEMNPKDS